MDIDLNCDLGEGCGTDQELIPLITSANICCGFHAGDPQVAAATLAAAARHGVQAGAHPGFPDREHFGRRDLPHSEQRVFEDTVYQVGALIALGRAAGAPVRYIKPHGAVYHLAMLQDAFARPVVSAAEFFGLPLMGMPGSRLEALSAGRCGYIAEGFADRRYRPDGTLVPRTEPDAFVADPAAAVRQVEWLLRDGGVHTICVHGDNPQALAFVNALREALTAAGHRIAAFKFASK